MDKNIRFEKADSEGLYHVLAPAGNIVARLQLVTLIKKDNKVWMSFVNGPAGFNSRDNQLIAAKLHELNRQLTGAGPAPMMIFISGKYTGKGKAETTRNIHTAEMYAFAVWNRGHVAVCPQLNSAMFDRKPEFKPTYDQVCAGYIALMKRCDAVLFIPNWRESRGARNERLEAEQDGMVIFEAVEEIPEISNVRRQTKKTRPVIEQARNWSPSVPPASRDLSLRNVSRRIFRAVSRCRA